MKKKILTYGKEIINNMEIIDIFKNAIEKKASDIFIIAGRPLSYKLAGDIVSYNDTSLSAEDTYGIIYNIFKLANQNNIDELSNEGDADFSFSLPKLGRFRVSAYKQRKFICCCNKSSVF